MKYFKRNLTPILTIGFLILTTLNLKAQSPVLKVDLNYASRTEEEVHEPGYTSWVLSTRTKTFEGVTFTFANGSTGGSWYKAGVQAPNYARLVNDGIKTSGVDLLIIGLEAGKHSLVTYHNNFDSPDGNKFPPMDVYVNNTLAADDVELTVRTLDNDSATTVYLEFEVEDNDTVRITFLADDPDTSYNSTIAICGFKLNGSDPDKLARFEYPEDLDEHVDVDNDSLAFYWTPPDNATSYNFYFGTNKSDVTQADTDSPLFLGNIADTFFLKTGFYSMDKFYWRVDPITPTDTTKGDVWFFRKRIRSFKGAEGYGGYAVGGREGKVVYVTNLDDDGEGSFREAVTSGIGARTVIFNVSGIIKLESRLTMDDSVTVAGQTAPGEGICFRAAPLGVSNECICRFIRMRLGAGTTYDGIGMAGVNNGIIDHCSISWGIDECFSSRNAENITLQHTLISEALCVAGHQNYDEGFDHGYAGSISGDIGSFHHNLLASCSGRNWSLAGGLDGDGNFAGRLDIFNMVVYNWGKHSCYNGAKEVNFHNNYYKRGPGTIQMSGPEVMLMADSPAEAYANSSTSTQRYFFDGNVMPGIFDESNQEDGRTPNYEDEAMYDTMYYKQWLDEPFFSSNAVVETAEEAYKSVLSDVGCTLPVFDVHDKRIIKETQTGTYTYIGSYTGHYGLIDDEDDAGGYEDYTTEQRPDNFDTDLDGLPNWWEVLFDSDTSSTEGDLSESQADPDRDGYTALEDYLYWMSVPHYYLADSDSVTIDLAGFTVGYTEGPAFSIAHSDENLTINRSDSIVTVSADSEGIFYFDFKVTDSESDTLVRTIGICSGAEEPESLYFEPPVYDDEDDEEDDDEEDINAINAIAALEVSVYPSFFEDQVHIDIYCDRTGSINAMLYDNTGKKIINTSYALTAGANKLELQCPNTLPQKLYLLQIMNMQSGEIIATKKLIKK